MQLVAVCYCLASDISIVLANRKFIVLAPNAKSANARERALNIKFDLPVIFKTDPYKYGSSPKDIHL